MLSKWSIRSKLRFGAGLLVAMVAILSISGFVAVYSYRGLAKSLSSRSTELPVAAELSQHVSDLRVTLSKVRGRLEFPVTEQDRPTLDKQLLREQFCMNLRAIDATLQNYRHLLDANLRRTNTRIRDDHQERETLHKIEAAVALIDQVNKNQDWMFDELQTDELIAEVDRLYVLTAELPSFLRRRFQLLANNVRLQYRTIIAVTSITSIAALVTFCTLVRLFYSWIFCPLRVLIEGSRRVAAGDFDHRIQVKTHDEVSGLADAMNDMTDRFQAICRDLDRQVRERTRQVVRSEQLASVGFLAAGVAHEINNPLASIAICSESLQRRLAGPPIEDEEDQKVVHDYLEMIHTEAFRCKEITEKLLDFSRTGERQHQRTELRQLVAGVIEMVGHMARYRDKQVELLDGDLVFAQVSPQEMKQVCLNLITNGLDSVENGGSVTIEIDKNGHDAAMVFTDNGCGMSEEVLRHIFEPFYTRKVGGQGTGLGLSITYRIIADHNGHIEATSDGLGQGSRFEVTLPLCETDHQKEHDHRYQAV